MLDVNHVFPSHEQEAWLAPTPLVSSEGAMGTIRPVEPSRRVEVLSCSPVTDIGIACPLELSTVYE